MQRMTPQVYTFLAKLVEYEGFWKALKESLLFRPKFLGAEWGELLELAPKDIIEKVRSGIVAPNHPLLAVPARAIDLWLLSAAKSNPLFGINMARGIGGLGWFWGFSDEDFARELQKRFRFVGGGLKLILAEKDKLGQKTAALFKDEWGRALGMDLGEMSFVAAAALAAAANVDREQPLPIIGLEWVLKSYANDLFEKVTPKAVGWLEYTAIRRGLKPQGHPGPG